MNSTFGKIVLMLFIATTLLTACLDGNNVNKEGLQKGGDWDTMRWNQDNWS